MKNTLLILFLLFCLNSFSQTQSEMNTNANIELKKADEELNQVYQRILSKYKSDSLFIDRLKKAQRSWITFRDAELEMKFPKQDKQTEYRSVYSMCASSYLKEMTNERTSKLNIWLTGIEEGDVCKGSVKTN